MKVFWSWQSDTPGKTGRFFVRDTLAEAIEVLRQPQDIEEPSEREQREAIELDHDRKGVSGSPDLAPLIFKKIEQAAVFVADVTLTGSVTTQGVGEPKRNINSNVAIEYGYAHHALSAEGVLLIQNTHYGPREDLPFDLRHKSGPIQYALAPDADAETIQTAKMKLRGQLVQALRLFLRPQPEAQFDEVNGTDNASVYFDRDEVLARIAPGTPDELEFRFQEPRAFYLRFIPTAALASSLKVAPLEALAVGRKVDTLTQNRFATLGDRNRFGAIVFEPPGGTATTPIAFTQLFRNGELWCVTRGLFVHHQNKLVIPSGNVDILYKRVIANFCQVAVEVHGLAPPFQFELGYVGLRDAWVGSAYYGKFVGPIHEDTIQLRRIVNDVSDATQQALVREFLVEIYDRAGVDAPPPDGRPGAGQTF